MRQGVLFRVEHAHIHGLRGVVHESASPPSFSWTIHDDAERECWAIVGPASSDAGGQVRQTIVDMLLGRKRPVLANALHVRHPHMHPMFDANALQKAIRYVPFETRPATTGEFTDYATRYGSIRDEDRVTLFESLMASRGIFTGLIARRRMRPDPLATTQNNTGLLKWENEHVRTAATQRAEREREMIQRIAPTLRLEPFLTRPVISLSNGQMRRARILDALVQGAQWVVLDDPFKGLDPSSRHDVSELFERLHAQRMPRICLVLREQDPIPSFVTHVLRIDEQGFITELGKATTHARPAVDELYPHGSYALVRRNAQQGIGVGQDASVPPIASFRDVSIHYGDATVLQNVSFALRPGARMVLVGDNGSGKTTLLSLLLGDHPRSFAFDAEQLELWGAARDAPQNAHTLLQRRVGHVSPELFHAFPRKSLEAGGLSVADAIASGFDGIFTHRRRTAAQMERVWRLIRQFAPELTHTNLCEPDPELVGKQPFASLPHGSQAVVLFLRSVVHRPLLLVLDEPFQGMSQRQVAKTRAYIDGESWVYEGIDDRTGGESESESERERMWRENLVLVTVSHYESEWPRTCGRLLRLSAGRVAECF